MKLIDFTPVTMNTSLTTAFIGLARKRASAGKFLPARPAVASRDGAEFRTVRAAEALICLKF
jgi:hypothetical protein